MKKKATETHLKPGDLIYILYQDEQPTECTVVYELDHITTVNGRAVNQASGMLSYVFVNVIPYDKIKCNSSIKLVNSRIHKVIKVPGIIAALYGK